MNVLWAKEITHATQTWENCPYLTRAEILGQAAHKTLIKEYALALEFIDMGLWKDAKGPF